MLLPRFSDSPSTASPYRLSGPLKVAPSRITSRIADVPVKLTHAGQVSDGGIIYLAGGFEGDHPGPSTSRVWKYDMGSNSWSVGPALPADRRGGGLVRLDR